MGVCIGISIGTGAGTDVNAIIACPTIAYSSNVPEIKCREPSEAPLRHEALVHEMQADFFEIYELTPNSEGIKHPSFDTRGTYVLHSLRG